jgi:Flp pilus assembly protein TadD
MLKNFLFPFLFLSFFLSGCKPLELKVQELMDKATEQVAQGQHHEAIKTFSRVIELMPDHARAYTFRGSAKFDLGDMEGAHDDYSKAIEIDPTYAEPYDFRGRIKLFWYDEKGACDDFRKAFTLGRPGMFERVRRCD